MSHADVFVSELESKNHDAYKRLVVSGYLPVLAGDNVTIPDLLRWESKQIVEAIEVAALWIADTESLDMKLLLALQAGRHAKHFRALEDRLSELGLAPGSYDPRQGGYSKLFAFWRSLQTGEERYAAGLLAGGSMTMERLQALATVCVDRGDPATAAICQDLMLPDEQARIDLGREKLLLLATAEDSQSRARRSVFRTVELLTEIHDTTSIRRALGRRKVLPPV